MDADTRPFVAVAPAPRNRQGTEARLLGAARAQLAEGGFLAFGVNGVARRAGCDKKLIYRYFGGLGGLADAIGQSLGEVQTAASAAMPDSYMDHVERVLLGWMEQFRADPLAQRIAAWEVVERGPLVDRLAEARMAALTARLQPPGPLAPPLGVDAPAVDAILLAAVQQLVLSAATRGGFAGLALAEDRNWIRVRLALRTLVRGVYRLGRPVPA